MRQLEGAHPRPELRARILATLPPMDAAPVPPTSVLRPQRGYSLRFAFAGAFCLLVLAGAFAIGRARKSGNTDQTTAVSPGRPAAPQHSIQAVPQNSPEIPQTPIIGEAPDPTSAEANRLYALEMKREKELAARKLPTQWKTVIAAVRAAHTEAQPHDQAYAMVAVDVKNIPAAEKRLGEWARASKATARIVPGTEKDGQALTASVVLTITTDSSSSLFADLKRTGDVTSVSRVAAGSAKFQGNPAVAVGADPASATGDSDGNRHYLSPTAAPGGTTGGAARVAAGKVSSASKITVLVQLVSPR